MILSAVTIFLSAFLLFQVQPLIAKMILPWFGGSAAVWSAAMLFFQLLLLGGYAYAHLSIRYLMPKAQIAVHAALLAVSCALLPILPSPRWKPEVAGDPTLRILIVLAATIGLPYFLLSSTSPLLQAWYARRRGAGMPYRFFALSNFGSMLALLSFPFVVEPQLTSRQQAYTWSVAYVLFAVLCAATAWAGREARSAGAPSFAAGEPTPTERPRLAQMLLWVALAACASALLVSVTNHLSQNVAPIPLLWVIPLALYLGTFILAFESDRAYSRWLLLPLGPALGGMAYMLYREGGNYAHIQWIIFWFAVCLFFCCLMCHGELARRKPAPRYLTQFYLMVSLGGAVGGLFVALIAPRVFHSYLELPVALIACATLAAIALWSAELRKAAAWALLSVLSIGFAGELVAAVFANSRLGLALHPDRWLLAALGACTMVAVAAVWNSSAGKLGAWPLRTLMLIGVGALAGYLAAHERESEKGYRLAVRNFYGVLHVRDDDASVGEYRERTLLHGTINHGSQLLSETLRYEPTSYYSKYSGVGRAILALQTRGAIRVGVIGLGAGVLSDWGRYGDTYRIYEINPLVEKIAQTEFSFYPHSPADKRILMGDARLTLERQEPQQFDVLAVDAFSSDAIPIHLLTSEALELYFRHLKPDGILALHVSNRYLDLVPVSARGAQNSGKQAMSVSDDDSENEFSYLSSSTWVLLTSQPEWFKAASFKGADMTEAVAPQRFRTWTDDYSNVFQILKLK